MRTTLRVEEHGQQDFRDTYINICTMPILYQHQKNPNQNETCISGMNLKKNLTDLMANFTSSVSFLIAPALHASSVSILHKKSKAISA